MNCRVLLVGTWLLAACRGKAEPVSFVPVHRGVAAETVFAPRRLDDLLDGTTVPEGGFIRGGERIHATAVPYHLWSNRGAGETAVWLDAVAPADRPATAPGRPASTSQP